ncbi:hypothetical protein L209DRAFT_270522 [Thermothelomyces heterothallicus CBS 203.75]
MELLKKRGLLLERDGGFLTRSRTANGLDVRKGGKQGWRKRRDLRGPSILADGARVRDRRPRMALTIRCGTRGPSSLAKIRKSSLPTGVKGWSLQSSLSSRVFGNLTFLTPHNTSYLVATICWHSKIVAPPVLTRIKKEMHGPFDGRRMAARRPQQGTLALQQINAVVRACNRVSSAWTLISCHQGFHRVPVSFQLCGTPPREPSSIAKPDVQRSCYAWLGPTKSMGPPAQPPMPFGDWLSRLSIPHAILSYFDGVTLMVTYNVVSTFAMRNQVCGVGGHKRDLKISGCSIPNTHTSYTIRRA